MVQHQILTTFSKITKFITFRFSADDYSNLTVQDLWYGLALTWLVGMGRNWDNPGASFFQHLGVGSIAYVFVLAAFLWILYKPIVQSLLTYRQLLTVIILTSLPAMFYAIPVERFMPADSATSANAWFLLIVATWRVALLVHYLRVSCKRRVYSVFALIILPLALMVIIISQFHAERVVFNGMGGFRVREPHDDLYHILSWLYILSWLAVIPTLLIYMIRVTDGFMKQYWQKKRNS
jgi:hypothetical protein